MDIDEYRKVTAQSLRNQGHTAFPWINTENFKGNSEIFGTMENVWCLAKSQAYNRDLRLL
jgi:uncharacterized phage-associated protein